MGGAGRAAGEVATIGLPAPRTGAWRIALDAGDAPFGGPAGTRLVDDGERLALPPLGAVVLVNDAPERQW